MAGSKTSRRVRKPSARDPSGYYRQPAVAGDRVVFVSEDDLWEVSLDGGVARRLTAGAGEATWPCVSSDGAWLAYTATTDGPTEAYVMPATGGEGRRLTHFGKMLRTVGFDPAGEQVRVSTNADQPFRSLFRLFDVPCEGGAAQLLPYGAARDIAEEEGGKGRVVALNAGDPARWKRYRGGTRGRLMIDRQGNGEFEPFFPTEGNVAHPLWIGDRIYFLSDHEGVANLYSLTVSGKALRRHTHHEDYFARGARTDGVHIVYHAGADLWLYELKTDQTRRLEVTLNSPRQRRQRRILPAVTHLETVRLHPEGHSLALSARGGAYALPLWSEAPFRYGKISEARYRLVDWLPDGKRLVAVGDEEGEEALLVFTRGRPEATRRVLGDFGRIVDLVVAPEGSDRVAFSNHRQEVWIAPLTGRGRPRRIDASRFGRIDGLAWSPDGRWLCYSVPVSHLAGHLRLYDTREQAVHHLTRPEFWDVSPSFDPDGRWLAFLSQRVFDPVYDTHAPNLAFPRGSVPCLIPLQADRRSPFETAGRAPRGPAANGPGKDAGRKAGEVVQIDLEGIADRVVAFPLPEARYLRIAAGRNVFFVTTDPVQGLLGDESWREGGEPQARNELLSYDLQERKTSTYRQKVTDFALTADAKTLGVRAGNRYRVLSAAKDLKDASTETDVGPQTGWADLQRLRAEVQPGAEWRQMFHEAWRLQRDQFWTPDMGGVDWRRVHDAYFPLVDRVATRSEVSDLIWEMQGELGTSHCYEFGGDYGPRTSHAQGQLGADLEPAGSGSGWRVRRVPRGDSWLDEAFSPLMSAGVAVRAGDVLLEIDGRPVNRRTTPSSLLVGAAGREVVLRVRRGSGKPRDVVVKALADDAPLRYRDWVAANRTYVHKKTRGKVGYVHIPDMGARGFSEFHRHFRHEAARDGLIVDVRFNGGGNVSQHLLAMLLRRRIGYDKTRWMGTLPYFSQAPSGRMVALTNEYAGSDGDIFSHAFQCLGLGPLIGMRTWGGVVGIWPRHALVDGTITTQPEFAYWFADVGYDIENYGVDPDIVVDLLPQDMAKERDPQLDRALAEVERILREKPVEAPSFRTPPRRAAPRLSPRPPRKGSAPPA